MDGAGMASDYVLEVIRNGDNASEVMHHVLKETLRFRPEVETIDASRGGLIVLRIPSGKKVVVHSAGGTSSIERSEEYAYSLIENLVVKAHAVGAEPIAFTDTLDMSAIDINSIKQAASGIYGAAQKYQVALVNGEIAGLGNRVRGAFNISGTMISYLPSSSGLSQGVTERNGVPYIVLESSGLPFFMNSDGVGTKIEIAEMTGNHNNMPDLIAMLGDDAAKKAATILAISSVLEMGGDNVPAGMLRREGRLLCDAMGAYFSMQQEYLGSRVGGYGGDPYNLGGTCISVIDEEYLSHLPAPQEGDYLVAIRNLSNPYTFRSNGISVVRKVFRDMFGDNWSIAEFLGKTAGEWAGSPSTVFYPSARALFGEGLISGFYHMSGGAFKGKLADPLSKLSLSARLDNLFEPSPAMVKLAEAGHLSSEELYQIWNMGNEAIVATNNPEEVMLRLKGFGLEGRVASQPLQNGAGVEIMAYNGEMVRF